jgi:hypothetical protein
MSKNDRYDFQTMEGFEKKGGVNGPPNEPRPLEPPKAQGTPIKPPAGGKK